MPSEKYAGGANLSRNNRMEIKLPIEAREIQEILPHRFPFLLLDRVIAAAGVSKGSFYQYFENKDDAYAHQRTHPTE